MTGPRHDGMKRGGYTHTRFEEERTGSHVDARFDLLLGNGLRIKI